MREIIIAVKVKRRYPNEVAVDIGGHEVLLTNAQLIMAIERGMDPANNYDQDITTEIILEGLKHGD